MGWKNRVATRYKINNIGIFSIKVYKNNTYDDIITKTSLREYQIDTYYHNTNILADSHVEYNLKDYLDY
jgi:hypothetical protein